jgi:hypothetical protein
MDVRWLTYEEMAAELGIARESARQLVKRKRWPRRPGNDGRARICVPEDVFLTRPNPGAAPAHEPGHGPGDNPAHEPADDPSQSQVQDPAVEVLTRHIERLERELEAMRERLAAQEMLPLQIAALNATLAELRQDRDHWRGMAERLTERRPGLIERIAAALRRAG